MKQAILFPIFIIFAFGCSSGIDFSRQETCMATFARVTCLGKNQELCRTALDKAFGEMERIENLLSKFKESSDIYRVNNLGANPVKVSKETFEVIKKVKLFCEASDGVFDISISPLLELWGFYNKGKIRSEVSDGVLREKLSLIGSDKIILDEDRYTVYFKIPGMAIDLGGVAKGYAVDKARDVMINLGVKNALINIGGEVYCLGQGNNRKGWSIGIQHPVRPDKIIAVINLKDKAVSTSGAYENFVELNGRRLGHIINPKTGYPVEGELVSVTVVADDCITTDALATAVFVLGKEKGLTLLKNFKAEGVLVSRTSDGLEVFATEKLRENLKKINNN